ncbi:DUF488 domain-containing protein [Lederbergia sp. NSJ-179]|uniref:DUF488 domain-containing protein n=1 Tax=Lederbergia sp. NSJ-179 TaxID=2931402 RepID=UPI001FD542C7|nr:DUF488 domain-containing protein [Lederbergia sp. NSJ-179]MCJ7843332.1 DUF488 domain-containing protein [Lederbergia sp. NSJ-179]
MVKKSHVFLGKGVLQMPSIKIKRIYDPYNQEDGARILVDRIWPRGIKKEDAKLEDWLKEIAPSSDLRKWFGHDPERFADFRKKYLQELREDNEKREALEQLCKRAEKQDITLVYAAKNEKHNQAVILKKEIEEKLR